MLLPATFVLPPVSALIMLAGIYYGAQYGGSTTAILVNLPGEVSSVVTCLDGYQMARQGKAGKALGVAAFASFFAGSVATLLIAGFAPPLAELALKFGPADYFSLMVLGLIAAVVLAHGSLDQGDRDDRARPADRPDRHRRELGRGALQLRPAGADRRHRHRHDRHGHLRLLRDHPQPRAGREARGLHQEHHGAAAQLGRHQAVRRCRSCAARRSGSLLGILPGGGPILGAFSAYTLEKKLAKDPSRFGKGAIEGVAAPESANNAAAQTSFIPLLTLGIPSNPVMALMIGAMIIHGIQPGPQIMTAKPELFWGMIASMWVGNLLLVVLNLPLIGMWVKLLSVEYRFLYPAILLFCCIGVYSINNATMDVYLTALFGFIGYIFIKLDSEPAPLLLGFVLGPMMEENLRRALLLSRGSPAVFFERPDQPHAADHLGASCWSS